MIRRLPRWVWSAAWALALIAGMVNVAGLLGLQQATTHLTGNTTLLAAALADFDLTASAHYAAIIGAFVAGTMFSGLLIQDTALRLGRRYGAALILESLLLCVAAVILHAGHAAGLYLAAAACGLQNAMITTYSGAVVRTTHLSGMFTDLGIALGHALRGLPVDVLRLKLCSAVISGFLAGGITGAVAFRKAGFLALLAPAALTLIMAAVSLRLRNRDTPPS